MVAAEEEGLRIFFERFQSRPRVVLVQLHGCFAPRRSGRVDAPPHGPDFFGQHRDQSVIRIASWGATKLQAAELIWNSSVPARVTGIVFVDHHGHDEAPPHDRLGSIPRLPPFPEHVAFFRSLCIRRDDRNEESNGSTNAAENFRLPLSARLYPS